MIMTKSFYRLQECQIIEKKVAQNKFKLEIKSVRCKCYKIFMLQINKLDRFSFFQVQYLRVKNFMGVLRALHTNIGLILKQNI